MRKIVSFTLDSPLFISMETEVDGESRSVQIDPYLFLRDCQLKAEETSESFWDRVHGEIARLFGVEPQSIARNQVFQFWDFANGIVEANDDSLKKKHGETQYLQLVTQASPATTGNGQSKQKSNGCAKSPTSEHGSQRKPASSTGATPQR